MAKQPYTEVPTISPTAEEMAGAMPYEASSEKSASAESRRWYLGGSMGKKILGFIVAVFVVYLLYLGYVHYHDSRMSESGEVHGFDPGVKDTADNDADTPSPVKKPRPYVQPEQPVAQNMVAPATDSISPHPTNGMAFTGTGKFQVYRQGNLTWRVDTETGHTCIVFATLEEWRKPIVYSHGCNNNG